MIFNNNAVVEIDLAKIHSNVLLFVEQMNKTNTQLLAVVKANAYGHGLVPVAKTAVAAGAKWLGVALLEEAIALREAGINAPIIAWLTPIGSDFQKAISLDIDLAVASLAVLKEIELAGTALNKKPRVHIEIDTGMIRGGFLYICSPKEANVSGEDFNHPWKELLQYLPQAKVEVVGTWTHFANSDEPSNSTNEMQSKAFNDAVAQLKACGINPQYLHIANTAAMMTNPKLFKNQHESQNLARLGISMYGLLPENHQHYQEFATQLKPAFALKVKIHLIKKVPAGSHVGYGGVGVVDQNTYLAILPVGYADGVSRITSQQAGAIINGKLAPLIGRVSMDQCVINLGPNTTLKDGDWITLIGGSVENIDMWAAACQSINYEVVTRIPTRIPRKYINGEKFCIAIDGNIIG